MNIHIKNIEWNTDLKYLPCAIQIPDIKNNPFLVSIDYTSGILTEDDIVDALENYYKQKIDYFDIFIKVSVPFKDAAVCCLQEELKELSPYEIIGFSEKIDDNPALPKEATVEVPFNMLRDYFYERKSNEHPFEKTRYKILYDFSQWIAEKDIDLEDTKGLIYYLENHNHYSAKEHIDKADEIKRLIETVEIDISKMSKAIVDLYEETINNNLETIKQEDPLFNGFQDYVYEEIRIRLQDGLKNVLNMFDDMAILIVEGEAPYDTVMFYYDAYDRFCLSTDNLTKQCVEVCESTAFKDSDLDGIKNEPFEESVRQYVTEKLKMIENKNFTVICEKEEDILEQDERV